MKRKLLFLMTAIAISATTASVLTSCDKDEPRPTGQTTTSVANTSWRAGDGTVYKFYSDGTCSLGNGGSQPYRQIGNEVDLVGNLAWYNKTIYHSRYAYVKGSTLEVELFFANEPLFTVKFNKIK